MRSPAVLLCLLITAGVAPAGTVTIGENFTGSTFSQSGYYPPDTMGAVGPNHVVELINGRYAVFDKATGTPVTSSSLNQFWGTAGVQYSGYTFDPRVLYDSSSDRWFAAAVDRGDASGNNFLVAVSGSSDPTAGWTGFLIDSDQDGTNSHWADFPTMGLDSAGVYICANMFPLATGSVVANVLVLPKAGLLAATPTVSGATLFENTNLNDIGYAIQPVVNLDGGGLPEYLLAEYNTPAGFIKLSSISGSIGSPNLVTAGGYLPVPTAGSPPDADQPGSKANIETNDPRISGNAVLVNGQIWAVQTVEYGGNAAIRWLRVDPVTGTVLETGIISDPDLDFYFPSIAVNDIGVVVIGFTGSGEDLYASSFAVVGEFYQGTTYFEDPVLLHEGLDDYQRISSSDPYRRNRWGDYSATVVDPSNSLTFWTFQEWVISDNVWATRITELEITPALVPEPSALALFAIAGAVLALRSRRRRRGNR